MLVAFFLLVSVIFLDACLSGDNAVVIAMAANGLEKAQRDKAILGGMILAAVLRIGLAYFAINLLQYSWIGFVGGLALLWVAWGLYQDMKPKEELGVGETKKPKTFAHAMVTIVIADLSMSIDNVLAVAGMARGHPVIMAIGILASIAMLAVAARWIADLMAKRPWINWIGIGMIVYVAVDLITGSF